MCFREVRMWKEEPVGWTKSESDEAPVKKDTLVEKKEIPEVALEVSKVIGSRDREVLDRDVRNGGIPKCNFL